MYRYIPIFFSERKRAGEKTVFVKTKQRSTCAFNVETQGDSFNPFNEFKNTCFLAEMWK